MTQQTTTTAAIADLTGDYEIDPTHSRIGFVARHAMVTKVRGHFREFAGRAHLDVAHPERSSAELTVVMTSVDTGNEQRDEHLRTNDFFDAPSHPKMTFRSTGVARTGEDSYRMTGELTLRGVTKPVEIDWEYTGSAKDPYGNLRAGFDGRATISRKDWGVEWNAPLEAGGVLVWDKVTLAFDVSAVRAQPGS